MKILTSPLFDTILGVIMITLAFLPPYDRSTAFFAVAGTIWVLSGVIRSKLNK
jgi:hypothetical protein